MMLDFHAYASSFMAPKSWATLEFWLFFALAIGCLWQLVHVDKFDIDGTIERALGRIGLVGQATISVAGVSDSFIADLPRPLFILYGVSTLLIQASTAMSGFRKKAARSTC